MYIGRIELQNWKNFKNAQANLSRRIFLVGPNASGKSNLLDALRFLRDVARRCHLAENSPVSGSSA